jgi:hypothetical protein
MKKVLVASILGLAAGAVSSYGQGTIIFNTYGSAAYAPAVWTSIVSKAPAGDAGTYVSQAGFTADLLYSDSAGSGDTYVGTPATPTVGQGITLSSVAGYSGGYIQGPAVLFAYTGGSVTFTIDVFQGASYAAASGGVNLGYGSLSWTEPASAIATGESPAGLFTALPSGYSLGGGPSTSPFVVQLNTVPEPTTLAILGLGAAGLLALRRRKA